MAGKPYICVLNKTLMTNKTIVRSNVNPLRIRELLLAGRSVLTFRNPKTGSHMTVKVKQARDKQDRKKRLPIFFVNVSLLGDSEYGYRFAGTIFSETGTMKLGRDVTSDSQLGRVMQFLMNSLRNPQSLKDANVAVMHEGHCCRCGLPLTHPESINTGFGPDCIKLVLAELENKVSAEDFFERI